MAGEQQAPMAVITVAIADAAPYGFADHGLLVRVEKIRYTDNELVAAIKAFAADDVVHVIPKSWRTEIKAPQP